MNVWRHKDRSGGLSVFRALCLACAWACVASSADAGLEPITARSQSGQFVVRGLPFGDPLAGYSTSAVQYLRLDPTLTAVSLERIRYEAVTLLGSNPTSRSLVQVNTHPVQGDDARVRLASVHFNDGWVYQLDLPDLIDRRMFIRTAVRVVLQEMANRKDVTDDAPLPPWLVEGLAAELQAMSAGTLALEMDPPGARGTQQQAGVDPLREARALLRQQPAMTFNQLCLPSDDDLGGENAALYRACAQVFVHELLRLRDGRKCLTGMLAQLHENLNWQTTFLRAFEKHFPRLVDADKWYAVNLASFSGREPMSLWPVETTLAQLDEVVSTAVKVRGSANDLPMSTTVSLQRILEEWDFSRQRPVLAQKVRQLQGLRMRGAREVSGLIDGYIKVLAGYLDSTRPVADGSPGARSRSAGRAQNAFSSANKQLDELDAQRETLRLRMAKNPRTP